MTSQIGLALRKMKGLRFADAAATPDATGEYMQFDGCFTGRDIGELSDHGYSYSMGIGASWSVQVPHRDTLQLKACYWRGGNAYNYGAPGHGKPHYPVPATIDNARVAVAHDDGALWQWLSDDERMFVLIG
jgi:hypothetical protein